MRRRHGRTKPVTAELAATPRTIEESEQVDVVSPAELFLAEYDESLTESARLWRTVAGAFEPFANGALEVELADMYPDALVALNDASPEETKLSDYELELEAKQVLRTLPRLSKDLATYFLVFISSHADEIAASRNPQEFFQHQMETDDPRIDPAVMWVCLQEQHWQAMARLPGLIIEGRQLRADVLTGLSKYAAQEPGIFDQLTALYGPDGNRGPHIREVQQMCAVDWYQPDKDKSVLRDYLERVRADEDRFLLDFVAAVEQAESGDKVFDLIKRMSRFALAAQGIDISSNPDVSQALLLARPQWHSFQEIDSAYHKLREQKIKGMEKSITAFVDLPSSARRSVRFPRTKGDFMVVRSMFEDYFDHDPSAKKIHREAERQMSGRSIPRLDVIEVEAEKPTYTLGVIKRINGGSGKGAIVLPADISELLSNVPKDQRTRQEVEQMLQMIIEDPFCEGSKILVGGHNGDNNIRIDGKTYPIRRFNPKARPGFSVGVASKGQRIYYVVCDHMVSVVDITSRENGGRKY